MSLPSDLQQAIEAITAKHSLSSLSNATKEVSSRYRAPNILHKSPALTSEQHRLSYLVTRLPATYGVIEAVLSELVHRVPTIQPRSLLDVGTGPGTAVWAATEAFALDQLTLLEKDAAFLQLGQQLMAHASHDAFKIANWHQADMTAFSGWTPHDLVLLSYTLGEIDSSQSLGVLKSCWESTRQALIVIEPGTPRGYETILTVRSALVEWGGTLVAPCPQEGRCPMEGTKDWCHFSCRIARSSTHRQAKGAALGHEDEKYSYVIATRGEGLPVTERVVRHPLRKSGHVHLELCTPDGIHKTVISKKQGETYQWAKKADWGDGRRLINPDNL